VNRGPVKASPERINPIIRGDFREKFSATFFAFFPEMGFNDYDFQVIIEPFSSDIEPQWKGISLA